MGELGLKNSGCHSSFGSGRVDFIKSLGDAHFWLPSKKSSEVTYLAVIALNSKLVGLLLYIGVGQCGKSLKSVDY